MTRTPGNNTSLRKKHPSTWTSAEQLPGVPADHAERVRKKWRSHINAVIDLVFEKLPITATSRKRLIDIASLVFTANLFPDNVSGVVVVAGFGEEDYTPGIVAYDMEGILLNFVKVRENERKSTAISSNEDAAIIPFAQGEMVYQFMEGIDPALRHVLQHILEDFVSSLTDNLVRITNVGKRDERTLRGQVEEAIKGLDERFFELVDSYSGQKNAEPVISAVAHLPKEELASMAESLVSLTSFKRRVTHDPETVGGPIDVAVISKGDGFIWINRKHYFDPKLNHQFFANYYQD